MKFGIFYEHQIPRPWDVHSEYRLLHESLKQIELADQLGFDYAWGGRCSSQLGYEPVLGARDRRELYIVLADNEQEPERNGTIFRTHTDVPGLAVPAAKV